MIEKGCDVFWMSDIVECMGILFGLLYQYFLDKVVVIGMFVECYNVVGYDCVWCDFVGMKMIDDLYVMFVCIMDSYYWMFVDELLMCDIWCVMQVDCVLQVLDCVDGEFLVGLFVDVLVEVVFDMMCVQCSVFVELMMIQIVVVVCYVIMLLLKVVWYMLVMFKCVLLCDLLVFDV